ncbi:hypothetical protein PoB_005953800, partial [Plakobranchus ocellatus]
MSNHIITIIIINYHSTVHYQDTIIYHPWRHQSGDLSLLVAPPKVLKPPKPVPVKISKPIVIKTSPPEDEEEEKVKYAEFLPVSGIEEGSGS